MRVAGLFLLLGVALCCCSVELVLERNDCRGNRSSATVSGELRPSPWLGNAKPDGASDEGKELDCSRYVLPGCPKILDPVCGTDNLTYPNVCMLCAENLKRKTNVRIKKAGKC